MFPRRGSKLLLDRITRFGLGVLDLAVGKWVYDRAVATGTGRDIPDFFGAVN